MLLYIIIGFLALSIVFYCLFGGADFGAGILGLFVERVHEEKISDIIGPVWEANHVWLVLAVVILFTGFPEIYATISLYLHIPIVLLLIGIILRGTAFTYMHYDAIKSRSTRAYAFIFKLSSVITPFFIGVIIGALMLGKINPDADTFYRGFVAPWLNGFSFSTGLFCICMFTFLASIFMIEEIKDKPERQTFIRAAKIAQISTVGSGALVFLSAWLYGFPLVSLFWNSWIAIAAIIITTLLLGGVWACLQADEAWWSRFLAGGQVLLILFAWFWVQHPVAINLRDGNQITFLNSAAPTSTLTQLLIALIAGSLLILPGLFILLKTFKLQRESSLNSDSPS